ncbi:TPA: hypothetical protein ACH20R_005394, partial [Klebsiella pneumoniae]|nr:hypothetical protein [Klebsiella pneumoniae]HDK5525266.1 hypothetical protein [Klebsiella pneumoniae]HED8807533.1 hypothetical protein [Klebsiella pneumoniae]
AKNMALTPPLGSTTPEVLLRNAGDLDRAMNSEDDTWQNRGGDELPTMKGYQKQVDAITDDVFQARDTAVEAAATLPTKQQFLELQVEVDGITADPANAIANITIPAKDFDLAVGSASFGMIASRLAGWQFTHGVNASITKMIDLPSHWSKMRISLIWTNLVANNNFNVSLSGERHSWSAGESFNQEPAGYAAVVPVNGTPFIAVETQLALDLTVDPTRHTTLRIGRNGASSSDTLPTAIALLAVRLTKVA